MNIAVVGSESLKFIDSDIEGLYRFAKNTAYPHPVSQIYTTSGEGAMRLARLMASDKGIPLQVIEGENVYQCIKQAIDAAQCAVIMRSSSETPWIAKYCARKGKLFQERVVI